MTRIPSIRAHAIEFTSFFPRTACNRLEDSRAGRKPNEGDGNRPSTLVSAAPNHGSPVSAPRGGLSTPLLDGSGQRAKRIVFCDRFFQPRFVDSDANGCGFLLVANDYGQCE
jgi:hypothetical protein